ncbi:MAG TPA: hypothetical protein VIQ11_06395 [Mycobacterium sp.]
MLATFGLERVESSLRRDSITAADVAGFLDQAEASDVDALARNGMDSAMHSLRRRLDAEGSAADRHVEPIPAPGLPTRQYIHHRVQQDANPEFQQTRHANPV